MAVWRGQRVADFGLALMSRRFPPPWTAEETDACFIVKDHTGHSLAHVDFEEESGRRASTGLMTRDEARWIAANIAKLPELLKRSELNSRADRLKKDRAARFFRRSATVPRPRKSMPCHR